MIFRRTVDAIVGLSELCFSSRAAWVDTKLAVLSGGWCWLMVNRPAIFDVGSFSSFTILPDPVWITFMAALCMLHVTGLFRPWWRSVRSAASLASAWVWIFVAITLARSGGWTGTLNYGVVGVGALLSAIYVAGRPRRVV